MSLIGDALRKRQSEGGDIKAAAPVPTPEAPPPATEAPKLSLRGHSTPVTQEAPVAEGIIKKPKKERRRPKAWVELAMVIAGLLVLILIAIVLFFYLRPELKSAETTPAPITTPAQPPTAPVPATTKEETAKPAGPISKTKEAIGAAEAIANEADQVIDSAQTEKPTLESVPATDEVTPATTTAEETPTTTIVATETSAPAPSPTPEEDLPVVWPPFSLQAAMGGGNKGSVLIDGKIIKVGDSHSGITIREITPDGVIMEFEGETKTVRVRR